jgi:hypothetical protein
MTSKLLAWNGNHYPPSHLQAPSLELFRLLVLHQCNYAYRNGIFRNLKLTFVDVVSFSFSQVGLEFLSAT